VSYKCKNIALQVVLPLIIGILIYATLRDQPPFKKFIPWDVPIYDISSLPRFLFIFIVYRLPDMLWTFAFISAINMHLKKTLLSAFIVLSVLVFFEYCQYEGLLSGTGDVGDIFYSLCSIIIYLLLYEEEEK